MPEIKSPYFDISYGWSYGEDGWGGPMDLNLLKLSFLANHTVNEFVDNLPESPEVGYSCILNSDELAYFYTENGYTFVELEVGYKFTTLIDGKSFRKTETGFVEETNVTGLPERVLELERDVLGIQDQVEDVEGVLEGIQEDASNLPVTSDGQEMPLTEWMDFVRNRDNHTGTQEASTISDLSEAIRAGIANTILSTTLSITEDGAIIFLEDETHFAAELVSVEGLLDINMVGGVYVPLTEDITSVTLPLGEFGRILRITVAIRQTEVIDPETDSYFSVSGWEDVTWSAGSAPTIPEEDDAVVLIELINVHNQGWFGFEVGSPVEGVSVDIDIGALEESISLLRDDIDRKIDSVVGGDGISVDNTDPTNPLVSVDVDFFSPVATTGSYNDLTDTPTLGSAASEDVASFDPAGTAEGVNTALTTLINERMSSAARDAVDALDPATATLEDLITALQLT